MRRNNVVDAIAAFKSALAVDPDHVISLVNIGAALGNMNDFKGAVSAAAAGSYVRCCCSMSAAIAVSVAIAAITSVTNATLQVQYYERAIAIDPAFTAARHNLASAYHSLKLHDKAAALFESIIAEQPENFDATISLAHVYRDLGRNERARDMSAASHP